MSVAVTFERVPYMVNVTVGTGGTMTPGTNTAVDHGDNLSFSVTPNEGYRVASSPVTGEPAELTAEPSYEITNSPPTMPVGVR